MDAMTRSHRSRGRAALIVLLAACALVIGVLAALQWTGEDEGPAVNADAEALAPWVEEDIGRLAAGRTTEREKTEGGTQSADRVDEREALVDVGAAIQAVDAHAVFGVIVDHEYGRPVAGAQLLIIASLPSADDPSEAVEEQRTGTTDEAGRFRITWPVILEPRITVLADGYVEMRRPSIAVDEEVELRLAPAASIEVIAGGAFPVGEAGGMAALIELRRGREGRRDPLLVELTEDGRALFADLAPGEFFISAGTPRTGVAFERISLDSGESSVVRLELPLAVRLSGRVLESEREVGVEGVEVRIRPSLQGVWREVEELREQSVLTDEAGRYEFPHVHPGNTHIELHSPWGDRTQRGLELSGSTGSVDYDFRIDAPAGLSGVVRDARGRPIEGALVRIGIDRSPPSLHQPKRESSQGTKNRSVIADGRGAFRFDNLPAGPNLSLSAAWREDGIYDGRHGAESISGIYRTRLYVGKAREDIELVLEPTASVSGVVKDADGQPIERARVELYSDKSNRTVRWAREYSSETGEFEVDGLIPGPYRVTITHGDYSRGRESITLTEGAHSELAFELERRSRITVVVYDESGNALSFANVSAERVDDETLTRSRGPSARTDHYGRAMIQGLEPGVWRVSAYARNHERPDDVPEVEVPGDAELEFVLKSLPVVERATVFGTVTTENGGVPRRLRFADRRGGSLEVEDGRFKLTGAKPGRTKLVLTAQDCVSHRFDELLLIPGGELDVGSIELERASRLLVVVTGPDGKRITKLSARLSSLPVDQGGYGEDEKARWGRSSGRGRSSFTGLPRRKWKLRVTSEGYVTHRQEIVIDALDERVDVQMKAKAN
jgi:protocatechuate 3,4-dioxygenase beta subunit